MKTKIFIPGIFAILAVIGFTFWAYAAKMNLFLKETVMVERKGTAIKR